MKGLGYRALLKILLLADFLQFFENVSKTHPFTLQPNINQYRSVKIVELKIKKLNKE